MPRHRPESPSAAKGSQEASQSLLPRLVHGISVLRPSFPEGCSIVDKDLALGLDLLRCLKHHMQLPRAIHANEESHKELGIRLPPAPSCIVTHGRRVHEGIAGHHEARAR